MRHGDSGAHAGHSAAKKVPMRYVPTRVEPLMTAPLT